MKTRIIKSKSFVEGRNLKRLCPRCEEYYFDYPALLRCERSDGGLGRC